MATDHPEPLSGFDELNPLIADLIRDHGKAIPPAVYQVLAAHHPSPVDRVVRSAEALYAAAQAATAPGERRAFAAACHRLAGFARENGFHDLGQTDRSAKMMGACRRHLGLGEQAAEADPELHPHFADHTPTPRRQRRKPAAKPAS